MQEIVRRITLPPAMTPPGPAWDAGYAAAARTTGMDPHLGRLDAALEYVGRHLNPALAALNDKRS